MKTSKKILSLFLAVSMLLTMLAGTFTVSAAETVVFSLTPSNATAGSKVFTFTDQPATITFGSNVAGHQSLATADDVTAYPGVEVGDMKITNLKTVVVTNPLTTASNLQLSATNPVGRMRYVVYYPAAVKDLGKDFSLNVQYTNGVDATASINADIEANGSISYRDSAPAVDANQSYGATMLYGQYVTFDFEVDFSEWDGTTVKSPTLRAYMNGTLIGESVTAREFATIESFKFGKIQFPSTTDTDAKSTHFVKEFSWTVMPANGGTEGGNGGNEDEDETDTPIIPATTYEVKFMNGLEEHDTQTVEENRYATVPAVPTKDGYTFLHWSTSEGGDAVNVGSTAITANTTFYAVFTEKVEVSGGGISTAFPYADRAAAVADGWKMKTDYEGNFDVVEGNLLYTQAGYTPAKVTSDFPNEIVYKFAKGVIDDDTANGAKLYADKYKGEVTVEATYALNYIMELNTKSPYMHIGIQGDAVAGYVRQTVSGTATYFTGLSGGQGNVASVTANTPVTIAYVLDTDSSELTISGPSSEVTKTVPPVKYIDTFFVKMLYRIEDGSTVEISDLDLSVVPSFNSQETAILEALPENLDSLFANSETRDAVKSNFTLPEVPGVTWKGDGAVTTVNGTNVTIIRAKNEDKTATISADFKVDGINYTKEYTFNVVGIGPQVNFYDKDGEFYAAVEYVAGGTVDSISAPVIENFDFIGWFEDGASESFDFDTVLGGEDLNLYAKYDVTKFNVNFFNKDGEPIATVPTTYNEPFGNNFPDATPPVDGMTFVEWRIMGSETAFTENTVVTEDMSVVAYYVNGERIVHTVTFMSEGEVVAIREVVDYGTVVEISEIPTKENYTFKCWEKNGVEYDFDTPVVEDITLVAAFKKQEFAIRFYDEDKTTLLAEKVGYYGEAFEDFPAGPPMTSDLRMFEKWMVSESEEFTRGYVITEAMDVYAKYADGQKVLYEADYTEFTSPVQFKNGLIVDQAHTTTKIDGGLKAVQVKSTPLENPDKANTVLEVAVGATFEGVIEEDEVNNTTITSDKFNGIYKLDLTFNRLVKNFDYSTLQGTTVTASNSYMTFSAGAYEPGNVQTRLNQAVTSRVNAASSKFYNSSSASSNTMLPGTSFKVDGDEALDSMHIIIDTINKTVKAWHNDQEDKAAIGPWQAQKVEYFNGFDVAFQQRMDIGSHFTVKNVKLTQLDIDEDDELYLRCMDVMKNQLPASLEYDASGNLVLPSVEGVIWSSSMPSVITATGTVIPGYVDTEVIVTASYAIDKYSYHKNYTITVPKGDYVNNQILSDTFTAENSLMNWSIGETSAEGEFTLSNDGVKIEKLTSSDNLTTMSKENVYFAYYNLFSEEAPYSAETRSATYAKDYKGVYDVSFTALADISSAAPASIALGYNVGNKFYSVASVDYSERRGQVLTYYPTAEKAETVLIHSSPSELKNLKFRVNTVTNELTLYDGDILLTNPPITFTNPFGDGEFKMFNTLRVTLDNNNEKDDYVLVKDIKVSELKPMEIVEKEAVLTAAEGLVMSAITSNPASLVGSINELPSTISGYAIEWASNSDQIRVDSGKVYQSSEPKDVIISAYISNASAEYPVTVRKDFHVSIPATTNEDLLAEYDLSKIAAITNQSYLAVTYDLNLPQIEGVVWTSSNTDVIGNDGKIQNVLITNDTPVTITATKGIHSLPINIVVKARAPMETLYQSASIESDKKATITLGGQPNIKVKGNTTISFNYTNNGTTGNAVIKDSTGKTAMDIVLSGEGIAFKCAGSLGNAVPVASNETVNVKLEYMPAAGKVAIRINDVFVDDYINLNRGVADFASIEFTDAALPISNIKVAAEGYTVLDVNVDNINYFNEVAEGYVRNSLTPLTRTITGAVATWHSGNPAVLSDEGILLSNDVPSFTTFDLTLTKGDVAKTYVNNIYVDCNAERNVFANATAAINSVPTASKPKEYAVDNNITTVFEMNGTSTDDRYISLDLGSIKTFNMIYVNAEGVDAYKVETSTDNRNWTEVKSGTITSEPTSSLITLDEKVTTRYVRFTVKKCSALSVIIREIRAYIIASADELADIDLQSITLSTVRPTDDFAVPPTGVNGTAFVWTSSHPEIIAISDDQALAMFTKPENGTTVTLTVTAEGTTKSRTFELYVDGSNAAGSGPEIVGGNTGGNGGGAGGGGAVTGGNKVDAVVPGTEFFGEETVAPSTSNASGYVDVADDAWYAEAVINLTKAGIVSGDGKGSFNPTDYVTREQFVKMLVVASGIELKDYDNEFADVTDDAWYTPYVLNAKANGIVMGVTEGNFGIGQNITRQDMAVLISRNLQSLGIELDTKSPAFTDDKTISNYAYDAVYAMRNLGLITGYEGAFSPKNNLTRAEAAKVIDAMIKLFEEIKK